MAAVEYEPLEAYALPDPYSLFRELRDEAPVHRSRDGMYCVSRWDDVQHVLKRTDLFSSEEMARLLMNGRFETVGFWRSIPFLVRYLWRTKVSPFGMSNARNLVSLDPPRHDAMRSTVNRGFTPTRIQSWEPRVREITDGLLQKLRRGEPFDVVKDLAAPLPATVIAEMIGVEPERQEEFRVWTDSVVRGISSPARSDPLADEFTEPITELTIYMKKVIEDRRRNRRDDLISVILDREGGELAMTSHEVLQFVILLLIAGNETTTNLISNATQALFDHPDVLHRVAEDPSELPRVVEETLRWQPPIQIVFRSTTQATEISGVAIPEGSTVVAMLAAANRDERRFADPERFDPWRDDQGHVGFGFGVHFCLGAALARLEGQVALEGLVPELVRLAPAVERPPLRESFLVRGLASLPVMARAES